ncbi:GAF domain-containing protein [Ruegeria aquimaris]|uniref:GAF domain-containing protein n=1 Tax=Ruegeria aquimaris TaxID=2984333 RepID=A0ABT3ARW7_9RHOB|nr:GAF domain-containing protein [Ruegeria sp. XHP0148]MCV2891426.1 GAF domain-containing protein [Ruegeria sp. XHP0148]
MNDDRWTFGLYVPEGDKLVMRVTRRWSRESEEASHREWKPGEGHVGQAFKTKRELVCRDSTDPNVRGFLIATGQNERSYDSELYMSFASVPIMIGTRPKPLGVLVATSDRRGRFAPSNNDDENGVLPDTVEPLRVAANVIATILCLTEAA